MRVLVTGGAGFIGSHLVDELLARGHEVLVLDDLSSGKRKNLPSGVHLEDMSVSSPNLRLLFSVFHPEAVFHLAAQIDVRRSVTDPVLDAETNVVGTLKLLEVCRRAGTSRIIFASTGGAIYGDQEVHPAAENHPTRPVSPYGVAKLSVEHYLYYYAAEHGFRVTSLRYANVYGPRQNPHGEAGAVAVFVDRLLEARSVLIHGDGEQTRDFVYVNDVVRANVLCLEKDLIGTFNVGTGTETSVNALFDQIRREIGSGAATHGMSRAGEQRRSCLDSSLLRTESGWAPTKSLDEGIRATVAWFKIPRR